jgi:hypothetical protein
LLIEGPPAQPSTVSKGAGGFVAQVSKLLFGIVCELAVNVTEANTERRIDVFFMNVNAFVIIQLW